jgi:hypothetical protein
MTGHPHPLGPIRFGGTRFSLSRRAKLAPAAGKEYTDSFANAGLPPGDKLKHVPRQSHTPYQCFNDEVFNK